MLQLEAERRIRDCHDAVGGIGYVGTVPVLEVVDRPLKNWRAVAKWMEDKLLGSLLLIFVGPLMALTAILIKLDSPGPVLFVQKRFGFYNEVIGGSNSAQCISIAPTRPGRSGQYETIRASLA
jgi:Bacterial sugar transferase